MAFLLGCEKVVVEFPSKRVLDGVSLGVNAGDRIGIVGRNGDGKSTLLALLAGQLEPDEGRVICTNGVSVGLLGQRDFLDDGDTVHHAIVGDLPEYEWAADARIRSIIDGIAGDIPWESSVGTLSGGQRRRVDLARLLVGTWDVIMLDEPTNHLDIRAINWLAQHLKTRWRAGEGALLVVTHDRWFLDEVCTSMWEVHDRGIEPFEGGFSAYIQQRVERERIAQVTEERRQNKLRRELAWLARGAQARSTKQKFRIKAAQELIADVPPLRNTLELKRMAVARLGKQVVDLNRATVAYGDNVVLDAVEWGIGPGDRVGIVGANGAGKTTLLNVLQGKLAPTSGFVKIGKTVRFAVLTQHLEGLLDFGTDRVRQVVGRFGHAVMLDGKDVTPRQLLERLGFTNADMNEPIRDLSGGQRRRLALMLILLEEPNVLILDEPGNDLDVDMLAAVEDLLDGWPGTLVLVTHDRYLMERVTDNQYAIIDGKIRHLPGGVDEYLQIMAERDAAHGARMGAAGGTRAGSAGGMRAGSAGGTRVGAAGATSRATGDARDGAHGARVGAAGAASRATGDASAPLQGDAASGMPLSNNELRALKKTLASTERKMQTMEQRIADATARMHDADPTDYVALGTIQGEIDELQAQLEELELIWLETSERLGA